MKLFSFCSLILIFNWSQLAASDFIKYEKGGFEKAQAIAKKEGKMIFIDFYASWCTPCKWMEETTFRDREVSTFLMKNFVAIKVNIDDFDGFDLKTKYDIRFLPTILIFNEDGIIIERTEETLSPSKMKLMLKKFSENPNHQPTHQLNVSPRESIKSADYTSPSNEGLSNQSSYRLQLGVFANFEAAHALSNELKNIFLDPVIIIQESKLNKTIYKVLLGEFKTVSEAKSFKELVSKDFNMKGVVY
jgi:thioredoxin 1